ncbi:MAG TPA: hypothetical protein PLW02_04455, partial [Verrucomicrobiota bacterium]|nr:hypothetical protein [Verrucomicrobiota bacterium]
VTEGRYFVKTHGHTHLSFESAPDIQLWETYVNDQKVIPVSNARQILIPLPSKGGPLMVVDLKWASKSKDKSKISLTTPALDVPILLTEWNISPDKNYRLKYVGGTIKPVSESSFSGFAGLVKMMRTSQGMFLVATLCLIALTAILYYVATCKLAGLQWVRRVCLVGGIIFSVISIISLLILIFLPVRSASDFERALSFLAPIQDAGKAISLQIENINVGKEGFSFSALFLGLLGIGLWVVSKIYSLEGFLKKLCIIGGWFMLFWGAMVMTNGIRIAIGLMIAFVLIHIVIPLVKLQMQASDAKNSQPQQPTPGGIVALFMASLFAAFSITDSYCAEPKKPESIVLNLNQQGRVQDNYVTVQAQMKWKAEAGARLDFLSFPAVLMNIEYQRQDIDHSAVTVDGKTFNRLIARQNGEFDIKFTYQIAYKKDGSVNTFVLPTTSSLVNKFDIELERLDQEVFSPNAVSIESGKVKRGDIEVTRATVVFEPRSGLTIGWRPRQRDVKSEKPLFYAELYHLFIPMPGVLEVISETDIRPAQGELDEITFTVPLPITVTDVQADFVSSWKFDPDKRILRVQFRSPQSKPFNFIVRSQIITTSLPYTVTNNFIYVEKSAGQVGMAGVATGNEVQLDKVNDDGLSLINLEDFPSKMVSAMTNQIPGLALRRAFRYSKQDAAITIAVSAVKPDIRAESQETLSLGEDRILLASQLNFNVARAGIFKLSFVLPRDYEVESISGDVLSHWTEMKSGEDRIITIHLRSKTEGSHTLNITLTGQGIGTRKEFEAPRLVLREAEKHTGQLVIVSELGIRLHIKTRDGLTQLDPLKSGIKQKGVQVFRILHPRWQLTADIESVEPLITVNSLLDVTIREGAIMNNVIMDYQIENAGVKTFRIKMPAAAENARFEGELISDFVKNQTQGQWAEWEVKLQRRVIGSYSLNIFYQIPLTNQQTVKILGVKALNANLQRGNLALRAGGRIELKVPSLPPGLQPAEWENIPQSLRKRESSETKDTFSALENEFELPITISRHEIAKVIPARIESLELLSVIASSGEMLTEGKLSIFPGDKRLLRIKLPESSRFWYAFVNGESAWPWLEKDEILIMLEKNSDPQKPSLVEFFYSLPNVSDKPDSVIKNLRGPSFDLPLQNVTWNINFPDEWKIKNWESSLQLSVPPYSSTARRVAASDYLKNEIERMRQQSKEAEDLIVKANALIQKGAPQQARRAFQAAQNIAPQDAALNEDARVQLHNLKMQQALIGLNQRQQAVVETPDKKKPTSQLFSQWTQGKEADYTQQQAKQVLEQSPAEENVALAKLAERLIRQQEAAVGKPAAIRPTLPELGARVTFSVPLKVEPWSDLSIKL